jgi:pyruvate,water dikinase
MKYLSDRLDDGIEKIGGKAFGLNVLKKKDNNINIPVYKVLTTDAFILCLKELNVNYNELIYDDIDNIKKIRNMLNDIKFPSSIEREIYEWFSQLERVCVRSSCVVEDSSIFSFAGIFESYLNIFTFRDLLNCIKKIWCSAFNDNNIAYLKNNNLHFSPMAVIIQDLKSPSVSGVCFYNNNKILIRSTFGLGIGIVSGNVKSDYLVLNKNGNILLSEISEKKEIYIPNINNSAMYKNMKTNYSIFNNEIKDLVVTEPDSRHAIIRVKLPDNIHELTSISKSTVTNIYDLFSKIISIVQLNSVDIEWCIDKDNNIFILQVRPLLSEIKENVKINASIAQPISGGIAIGYLCFINNKDDIRKINKNSIVVMNWMPEIITSIMMRVKGIVIYSWQNMSHFALLVREWNIPCIAAVDSNQLIENKRVKINGSTGEINYISEEDNSIEDYSEMDYNDNNKYLWPYYVNLLLRSYMEKNNQNKIEDEYRNIYKNKSDLFMMDFIRNSQLGNQYNELYDILISYNKKY